jgi:hypothetical protein
VAESYLADSADVAAAKATFSAQFDAIDNALNAPTPVWPYSLLPAASYAVPLLAAAPASDGQESIL